jgi:hypothetical protein
VHWARGSAWRHGLLNGATFAVFMTAFYRLQSGSWTVALVSGSIAAVIFGAVTGPIHARQQRRAEEAAGDLDRSAQRRAARAAVRGAVPDDPEVRAAAARLAAHRREEVERHRWWTTAIFLVFAGLGVWVAVTEQPWMWLGVAFFLSACVAQSWGPRHLRRRETRLAETGGGDGSDVVRAGS